MLVILTLLKHLHLKFVESKSLSLPVLCCYFSCRLLCKYLGNYNLWFLFLSVVQVGFAFPLFLADYSSPDNISRN